MLSKDAGHQALQSLLAVDPPLTFESPAPASPQVLVDPHEDRRLKLAHAILCKQAANMASMGSILPQNLAPKQITQAQGFIQKLMKPKVAPPQPTVGPGQQPQPQQAQAMPQLPGAGNSANANPINAFGGISVNPMNVNGNAAFGTQNSKIKTS